MERLTERCDYGWVRIVAKQVTTHCGDFPCKDVGGCERSKDRTCPWLKTIDRLASYEDTGLEPEDMKRVFSEDAILKLAGQALGTTAEHLRNLLSIEKAGRLVVLSDAEADALKAYREGRMEIKCQGCWPVDGETAERPKCFYNDNESPLCLGLAVGDDDYPIEKCQKCWYSEYASVDRAEAEAALGKEQEK